MAKIKIKQLSDKGENFFPITNTKAVYDDAGNRLDNTINTLTENLTASDNLQFKFGKDGDGNYGYYGADGSLIPFKSDLKYDFFSSSNYNSGTKVEVDSKYKECKRVVIVISWHNGIGTFDVDCIDNKVYDMGSSGGGSAGNPQHELTTNGSVFFDGDKLYCDFKLGTGKYEAMFIS